MNTIYVAFDGDSAGRQVGQAILMDDIETLHDISNRITAGSQAIKEWVEQNGGQMISFGGDEGTFMIHSDALEMLEQAREMFKRASGLTATFGVGQSISQAGKSLIAGKLTGKNQVKQYDHDVEQLLQEADQHAKAGTGTEEENKQDEHYLSDTVGQGSDGKYPQDWNKEPDGSANSGEEGGDVQYPENWEQEPDGAASASQGEPQDEEQDQESGQEAAPEAEEPNAEMPQGNQEESSPEAEAGQEGDSEEGECGCEICQAINQDDPAAVGEEVPQEEAPEQAASPDAAEGIAAAPAQEGEDQSFEEEKPLKFKDNKAMEDQEDPDAMEEATPPIEGQDASGDPEQDMQAQIDSIAGDDQDEESAPEEGAVPEEGEPTDIPQDNDAMSLEQPTEASDQAPQEDGQVSDMDMLSELLADAGTADETKAKIAQILEKFKANRDVIMSMKDSNPEMYQSIIVMLKQMIDMARHLAPAAPEEDTPPQEAEAAADPQEGSEPPKM